MIRPLLVDPSTRGGISAYTEMIGEALAAVGADPAVLGSCALGDADGPPPLAARLPAERWGKPQGATVGFYAGRLTAWARSAAVIAAAAARPAADVVHFQAPINRRLDAHLVRFLARRRPVVWTAHDVLPFECTDADRDRFAAIYAAADRVIVHTEPAAEQVRELADVEPDVIEHPVRSNFNRTDRASARRELGLPERGRVLAALGFIRPYKGYGLLADVWEQLGEAAPTLLLMGELLIDEVRPVIDRIASCPAADVRLGYASERELELAVCASDALLLPYVNASDSGLVHLGRAAGVPVLASDVPQLAASVRASRAGAVVPRKPDAWAAAVTGELPPPPPRPPAPAEVGLRHLDVYRRARAGRRADRSFRLVLYTDAHELGGAEGMLADLAATLDRRIDVVVMGVDEPVVATIAQARAGAQVRLVPRVAGKRDLRAIAAHRRALRELDADLFQANLRHPWSCQYGLFAAATIPRLSAIAVEHAVVPASAELQRRLKRLTTARLAAHVAVGHRAARNVEHVVGLRPGAVRTIHNGVRSREPAPRRGRERATVCAIGRLSAEKGYDVLLHALAGMPDVGAVLVGEGPERSALERLRAELGLEQRVRMPGWSAEPADALNECDALVLPSRWESFPLVVLEAMHAGLPVVASDVGSVAEAVVDGETGLLVRPGEVEPLRDAIRRVGDRDVAARMGEAGRARARELFTTERMAAQYEELYGTVLG